MIWRSVKDELPVIPEGRRAVRVLVAEFDPCYDELNPGHGYTVHETVFGYCPVSEIVPEPPVEPMFLVLYTGMGSFFGPCVDEITHWMYLPEAPK